MEIEATNPVEPEVVEPEEIETQDSDETTDEQPEAEPQFDEEGNLIEPDEADADDAGDDEPDDDGLEDVEIDGKQYRVPKDAALRQADYTRKTQEVAELRKKFEALTAQAEESSEAEKAAQDKVSRLRARIGQYSDIDWQAWRAQDPIGAMQGQVDLQTLQQQLTTAQHEFNSAANERVALANSQREERLREGHKQLAERIPDWGETKQRQLTQVGRDSYGFTDEELNAIDDPRMILVLNDAAQFAASQKKQRVQAKVAKQEAVKPAAKVRGAGSTPRKAMDDRSDINTWMAARQKQVRA